MKKLTTAEFVEKAQEVWGGRWDYSHTIYDGATVPITVVCSQHGSFKQHPTSHLRGNVGCRKCSAWKASPSEFLVKASKIWEQRWDYSEVEYTNATTKVKIICREHGPFYQTPKKHLVGNVGCSKCNGQRMTTQEFIEKARGVWGDRWGYLEMEYTRSQEEVQIECPQHGPFYQRPNNHLSGSVGCRSCNIGKSGTPLSTDEFINRSREVWGSRWNYSSTKYQGTKNSLTLTCPDHGDFIQPPDSHFLGRVGCRRCRPVGISSSEAALAEFVTSLGVDVERHVRALVPGRNLEVDMYVDSCRTALEFNGLYWHSEQFRTPNYHRDKTNLLKDQGIRLIHVWEDDWDLKRSIMEEHIRQVLGVSKLAKVSARATRVVHISKIQAREFMTEFHIQGFSPSSVYLGLQHGSDLVAVGSFKRSGSDYVLTRYATSANVRGGHSKIVAHFESEFSYDQLVTFADLAFSYGNLYRHTGWVEDSILPPDYSYIVKGKRAHKFGYRLQKFKTSSNLQFVPGATERELAQLNGLFRVYDAGKIRFIKKHP